MSRWVVVAGVFAGVACGCARGDGPVVRVGFDKEVCSRAVSGRLIVLMKARRPGSGDVVTPLDGPSWEEERPLFAVDVKDLAPGAWVEVGAGADALPVAMDKLAPGEYVAQARLDTQRTDSDWRREVGNLYSKGRATLVIKEKGDAPKVELKLDAVTEEPERRAVEGVEWFSVRSELLSAFRGREVAMRAGVVLPVGYDPAKTYAAVYEAPGFGGNDVGAAGVARERHAQTPSSAGSERRAPSPAEPEEGGAELARSAFWIVLDPEGPNGHTLFADSANNGPCGRALVEELIPALERKFPLVARPEARLLRGHSSGGWSSLWLATEYPGVFGACWSTSPDPVDFRRFQLLNLYAAHRFYGFTINGLRSTEAFAAEEWARKAPQGIVPAAASEGPAGVDLLASYRRDGKAVMTVKREAQGEDVLGPDNTSGQQWDSWFAAWGPRNERGNPAALFDVETGVIDRATAEAYRKYDIADRLRKEPGKYGPVFRKRVRLVVGDTDNFFLNGAVELLKKDVEAVKREGAGYVKIVPGFDHGSIFSSAEVKGFEEEMAAHLRGVGLGK